MKIQFSEMATQVRGVSYKSGEATDTAEDGYVPLLRANNIQNGKIVLDDIIFVPERVVKPDQYMRLGDIIIATSSGSIEVVGKAARFDLSGKFAFGAFCKVLRPKLNAKVDSKFLSLYFYTRQYRDYIRKVAAGSNINNLRNSHLDQIAITVPSIEQQLFQIEKIEHCIQINDTRLRQTDLLKDYLSALFFEMFGDPINNPKRWPKRKFDAIVPKIESGWSPSCESRPATTDEVGVLKLGAITWGEYDDSENKAYPKRDKFDSSIEVKKGDLLFCRKNTRELVAGTAYVFSTRPGLMMPDLIFRLNPFPGSNFSSIFLWKLLSNLSQRDQIRALATGSAGSMPNISKEKLSNVELISPPLDLQQKFSDIVSATHITDIKMRKARSSTMSLFDSLLAETFNANQ